MLTAGNEVVAALDEVENAPRRPARGQRHAVRPGVGQVHQLAVGRDLAAGGEAVDVELVGLHVGDQLVDLVGGQALEEAVVDLRRRGGPAGTQALHLHEGGHAILGGATNSAPKTLLEAIKDLARAHQQA